MYDVKTLCVDIFNWMFGNFVMNIWCRISISVLWPHAYDDVFCVAWKFKEIEYDLIRITVRARPFIHSRSKKMIYQSFLALLKTICFKLPPHRQSQVFAKRALNTAKNDTNTCLELALLWRLFHFQESRKCKLIIKYWLFAYKDCANHCTSWLNIATLICVVLMLKFQ